MISPKIQKAIDLKFASKAQCLQYFVKEYCKKFKPQYKGREQEFYNEWKKYKKISSANDFTDDELDFYISSFEAALDNNIE